LDFNQILSFQCTWDPETAVSILCESYDCACVFQHLTRLNFFRFLLSLIFVLSIAVSILAFAFDFSIFSDLEVVEVFRGLETC